MPNKKIIQKIAVGAVIFDSKNQVLILQRHSSEEILPNLWELPSGRRKFLESSQKAILREVKEETGLKVKIIMPLSVFEYKIEKPKEIRDTTFIIFLAKAINKQKAKISPEHQAYAWITENEINKYEVSKEVKGILRGAFPLYHKIFS